VCVVVVVLVMLVVVVVGGYCDMKGISGPGKEYHTSPVRLKIRETTPQITRRAQCLADRSRQRSAQAEEHM
jgi:hypothetical protein